MITVYGHKGASGTLNNLYKVNREISEDSHPELCTKVHYNLICTLVKHSLFSYLDSHLRFMLFFAWSLQFMSLQYTSTVHKGIHLQDVERKNTARKEKKHQQQIMSIRTSAPNLA